MAMSAWEGTVRANWYLNPTSCWFSQFLGNFLCTVRGVSGSKLKLTPWDIGRGVCVWGSLGGHEGHEALVYQTTYFFSFIKICLLKRDSLNSLPLPYVQKGKPGINLPGRKRTDCSLEKLGAPHNEKSRSPLATLWFSSPGGMPCPSPAQNFWLFYFSASFLKTAYIHR